MKHAVLVPLFLAGLLPAHAQWCVPTTAIPYAASMPGITQFTCATIDRTSADIENYPGNSYVNTGLQATLMRGNTYPTSIGFTIDNLISPHMNLRLWIDLNHDGQLDDVGETLLSADHQAGPQYSSQITIPATAMTGPTRMRVTAKMCSHGGHSLPTPCDFPADPLGYHGEIEDYTVDIVDAVGLAERELLVHYTLSTDATHATFLFALQQAVPVRVELLDLAGRVLHGGAEQLLTPGEHRVQVPLAAAHGVYLGRLWVQGTPHTLRTLH